VICCVAPEVAGEDKSSDLIESNAGEVQLRALRLNLVGDDET